MKKDAKRIDNLVGKVRREDHCVTDLIGVRNELRRPQVSATLLGASAVACGAIGYAVRGLLRRPARK